MLGGMDAEERIDPPPPAMVALQGLAFAELAALVPSLPWLRSAPRGDGHPVLVLPGFLASDLSTIVLRRFLRDRGYHAHGWRLGTNRGPTPDIVAGLGQRFLALRARHGRPLSLVGWSLGGIYARELARRFPDDVRQVITLGSPFVDPQASVVAALARRLGVTDPRPAPTDLREPLAVPTTSIYSRIDGIVAWRSCLERPGPERENVQVWSSHNGMGHHPRVLMIIADRLAQTPGAWRPYAA